MNNYIFLTDEGYTFQPDSESETPDIENLQVIGFASGTTAEKAYKNILVTYPYLKRTTFNNIFCYKLDDQYEESRKNFCLKR